MREFVEIAVYLALFVSMIIYVHNERKYDREMRKRRLERLEKECEELNKHWDLLFHENTEKHKNIQDKIIKDWAEGKISKEQFLKDFSDSIAARREEWEEMLHIRFPDIFSEDKFKKRK